ncbi:pyruvate synthase subunit beta [Candidatus Woesearchaeota archaeon]|nr:pyruvate synthase subunit beta [Candidatus Woesearchaeota archaeon]
MPKKKKSKDNEKKKDLIAGLPKKEHISQGHRACAGCANILAVRHALKAAGKDVIVVSATGCMEVVTSPYPQTAWKVPWIHATFENAGAVASGIAESLKKQNNSKTKVLAIAGDGGTFDIGLQSLSGAVERNHDFTYICYDNEAYMNTGIQRSGSTPKYAATTTSPAGKKIHGKIEFKKHMPMIIAAHNENVYVATANMAYPMDYYKKVKKGLEHKGPAYIQVLCTCVPGWKVPSNISIDLLKLAYNAKITPLYEIENGKLKFTMKPEKPISVNRYLNLQGRFKHLNKAEIAEIQEHVDEEFEKLEKLEESEVKI